MSADDNETVAEIVSEMRIFTCRNLATGELEDCVTTQKYFANRIEAAHKREIDSLNFKLMTAKSEQNTAANVIIEQTNKVEKLEREIEELRECLKEAFEEKCSGTIPCDDCWGHHYCQFKRWRKALAQGEVG